MEGGVIHYWACFRSNPNMTLFVGKHLNTMAVTVGDGIKRVLGKYFPELVIFVFTELTSFPETANFCNIQNTDTKTSKVPSVVFKFDQTRHKVSVKQTYKTHILWKKFQNCPISVSSNKHKKQVFLKRSTK